MTQERIKRIHQIYGAVLSVVIVIAGICLMVQCNAIYRSGDHPFSREAVAAHFAPIALPVYLCLAMVIGGFLLRWLLPDEPSKQKMGKNDILILRRLHARTDLSQCDPALQQAVAAQQKRRSTLRILRNGICAVCAVVFLSYGLNSGNFHQSQINDSMIKAMYRFVPCLLVSFGAAVFTAYQSKKSLRAEIELMRQANAVAKVPAGPEPEPENRDKQTVTARRIIAVVAIALLLFGFFTGGTADVLTKAVNICTECVGLG